MKKGFLIHCFAFLLFATSILFPTTASFAQQHCEGTEVYKEFPNHFKEIKDYQKFEDLMEKAMGSILERLKLPYVENDEIKVKGFFEHITKQAKGKNVSIMVSGGVIRTLLGYIYQKVYYDQRRKKSATVEEALEKIINNPKEIVPFQVLGIGSDLDLLYGGKEFWKKREDDKCQQNALLDEVTKSTCFQDLTNFINSAEEKLGLRSWTDSTKHSLIPIGDVKNYQQQIERASVQGGSDLDLLAFDLETKKIIFPPETRKGEHVYGDILKRFQQGCYSYLKPRSSTDSGDQSKQSIRGLRALFEIPFLSLDKEGDELLAEELKKIKEGKIPLSEDAKKQVEKLSRNSRMSAGNNRKDKDKLASVKVFQEMNKEMSLGVPSFLDLHQTENKSGIPKEFLLSRYELEREHPYMYHGTRLNGALCIIRNGPIRSDNTQGTTAACGPGAYTTKEESIAVSYADSKKGVNCFDQGCILPFTFKESSKLKKEPLILNYRADGIADWFKLKGKNNIDEQFDYLKSLGVDVVINEHILLQTSDIINKPKSFDDLFALQLNKIKMRGSAGAIESTLSLLPLAKLYNPKIAEKILDLFSKEKDSEISRLWFSFYLKAELYNPKIEEKILDFFSKEKDSEKLGAWLLVFLKEGKIDLFLKAFSKMPPGSNFNPADKDGGTLLHFAGESGDLKIVKAILAKMPAGSDFNPVDKFGDTPLHLAAKSGKLEIVEAIWAKMPVGSDFNPANQSGNTPLHLAAKSKKLEIVEAILAKMPPESNFNPADKDGGTLLHFVAESRDLKIVKAIWAKMPPGSDFNPVDKFGDTPLHKAAQLGTLEMVNAILEKIPAGSDFNPANQFGNTPLHLAAKSKKLEIVEAIWAKMPVGSNFNPEDQSGNTPLHFVAKSGNLEVFNAIWAKITADSDFNFADENGRTLLHFAVESRNIEMFNAILANMPAGSDFNPADKNGHTLLHFAVQSGDLKIVKAIWAKMPPGSDFNPVDKFGDTPLHKAAQFGTLEMVNAILEKIPAGSDFNRANGYGQTPLSLAHQYNDLKKVKSILEKIRPGNHFSITNMEATILLYLAMSYGDQEVIKLILEKMPPEINFNISHWGEPAYMRGEDPFALAIQTGNLEVVKAILERMPPGNNPNPKNQFWGRDILTVTVFNGHPEIGEIILQKIPKETIFNIKESSSDGFFYESSKKGYTEIVKIALEKMPEKIDNNTRDDLNKIINDPLIKPEIKKLIQERIDKK